MQERSYRVKEVAAILGLSVRSVRRLFRNEPGVEVIGDPFGSDLKRAYSMMLIPDSVLERVRSQWRRRRRVA